MNDETQRLQKPNLTRINALINIDTRKRFDLRQDRLAIGRLPENKIPLPDDSYVSGLHAVVFLEGNTWWVQDLNSTNGTFKNNAPVTGRVPIEPGDFITFGQTKFEVV